MTNEFIHFEKISRKTWQNLHRKTTPPLTQKELNSIKSFNDKISLQDVTDVYLPLTSLIQIYKRSKEDLAFSKGIFLQKASKRQPFIIGVSCRSKISSSAKAFQKVITWSCCLIFLTISKMDKTTKSLFIHMKFMILFLIKNSLLQLQILSWLKVSTFSKIHKMNAFI